MPKTKFALESDGPQRLEIKWDSGWFYPPGGAKVFLDGNPVGTIPYAELRGGKEFRLPDSSSLRVSFVGGKPQVFHDGKSLNAIEHPRAMLTWAYRMIFVFAALHVWVGLVDFTAPTFFRDSSTIGSTMILIFGILFFLLGWWAKSKSRAAFVLSLLLYVVQICIWSVWQGYMPATMFFPGMMMILITVQGVVGIQKINRNQTSVSS